MLCPKLGKTSLLGRITLLVDLINEKVEYLPVRV